MSLGLALDKGPCRGSHEMTEDLEYYMSQAHTIEITPDVDGYWFAEIPLLGGCMTNGENWNDAPGMIEDARRAWFTTALEMGMPIPEPQPVARSKSA